MIPQMISYKEFKWAFYVVIALIVISFIGGLVVGKVFGL